MTFLTTTTVKRLVVDLLRAVCKQTSNTLDDRAVDILEKQLFPACLEAAREASWQWAEEDSAWGAA